MTGEVLPGASSFYIDTNIFIYLVEGRGIHRDLARMIMQGLMQRQVQLVSSALAHAECLHGVYKHDRPDFIPLYHAMLYGITAPKLVPLEPDTLALAANYAATFSMKLLDAIHVACAVRSGCDHLLTNDSGMRSPETLKIVNLGSLTIDEL